MHEYQCLEGPQSRVPGCLCRELFAQSVRRLVVAEEWIGGVGGDGGGKEGSSPVITAGAG